MREIKYKVKRKDVDSWAIITLPDDLGKVWGNEYDWKTFRQYTGSLDKKKK